MHPAIIAMGDNVIGKVFDEIQQRFSDAWTTVFDPIYVWYFWGLVFLVVVLIIAFFAPFKWVRAGLGVAVLIVAAYIAGGRQMSQSMRDKLAEERRKRKEAEAAAKDDNQSGGTWPGGGWFGSNW